MRDQAPAVDNEDVPPDSGHVAHELMDQQQPARQPEENTAKLIASGSQATEQPSSESKQSALVTVRGSALGDSSPLQPNAALSGSMPGLAQEIGPAASLSSASLPAVLAQQLQPQAPSPSPSRQSFSQRVLGSHGSHSKPSRLSPRGMASGPFASSCTMVTVSDCMANQSSWILFCLWMFHGSTRMSLDRKTHLSAEIGKLWQRQVRLATQPQRQACPCKIKPDLPRALSWSW